MLPKQVCAPFGGLLTNADGLGSATVRRVVSTRMAGVLEEVHDGEQRFGGRRIRNPERDA